MNHNDLCNNLMGMKGSAIVTLHTVTTPPMASYSPYKGIVKHADVNGVINWIYETAVNRQRIREGKTPDFQSFPRKWGQRLHGTPLVEHKGKHYLEVKVQKSNCTYFLGQNQINNMDVNAWLRPIYPSRQGIDKEIILRDYAIENIKSITWGGVTYVID